MTIALYMGVHIRRAVTNGLRLRGIDVLTAQEDDASRLPDPELQTSAMDSVGEQSVSNAFFNRWNFGQRYNLPFTL